MNYKYKNGQEVYYDNGVFKGNALVIGYATTEQPVIGSMLILEDLSSVFPTIDYPFTHFTCAECHVTPEWFADVGSCSGKTSTKKDVGSKSLALQSVGRLIRSSKTSTKKDKGRKFVRLSGVGSREQILEEKLRLLPGEDNENPFNGGDFYCIRDLTKQVAQDLAKCKFDCEDCNWTDNGNGLLGLHTLSNGLSIMGVSAGGDWETPCYFLLYFDGKQIRAYIPEKGN